MRKYLFLVFVMIGCSSSEVVKTGKNLETKNNTIQHAGLFSLLVIFGIPAVILIAGFSVWFRRRKA